MTVQNTIEQKLQRDFTSQVQDVVNESHMHNVAPNSETHFKVTLVCEQFNGVRKVARHQQVYKTLSEELAGSVHALALHTYTPEEWQQRPAAPKSPECLGGS
jgi:BolA protein